MVRDFEGLFLSIEFLVRFFGHLLLYEKETIEAKHLKRKGRRTKAGLLGYEINSSHF